MSTRARRGRRPDLFARRALAAGAVALLGGAVPALALPEGSTFLVSRPDGVTPPAAPVTNHSVTSETAGSADPIGRTAPRTLSDDGRYMVFVSNADGLVADDDDRFFNVYLRDRQLQTTTLISRATGVAGAAANGPSSSPSISANGRWIAFTSSATNLSDFDEGGVSHVYLRDTVTGTTTLVDRADGASGVIANEGSGSPSVAVRGGQPAVAFVTFADNLVADPVPANRSQVYMRVSGSTVLVSRRDGGLATPNAPGNDSSFQPSFSADGQRIAFATSATNMINGDANGVDDVYVRTLDTSATTWVSLSESGAPLNGDSGAPAISADGSHVAWVSAANDVTDFSNADLDTEVDVYIRPVDAGGTQLLSRATGSGGAKANTDAISPMISADEQRVLFTTNATNLNAGDTNGVADVYMRRRDTNATVLVSQAGGGVGDGASGAPTISGDGEIAGFESDADNLFADDDDDFRQVFTRYVGPLPSINPIGHVSRPGGTGPFRSGVNDSFHVPPSRSGTAVSGASSDGRYLVFLSAEDDLVPDDDNRHINVFLRDTVLDRTFLVSRASGATGAPANGPSGSFDGNQATGIGAPAITPDGRYVAFASAATNLVPGDGNGQFDVFVRDMVAATTSRVSLRPDGTEIPGGGSNPAISADGNRIAFVTPTALSGDDTNGGNLDVYVRDLAAAATVLASRQTGAGVSGNSGSSDPAISGDGQRVAFVTSSNNLAPPGVDGNGVSDVYMRNLTTDSTTLVSARAQLLLQAGDASSYSPAANHDGTRIAFTSNAANLVGSFDVNTAADVYLRDFTLPGGSQTVLVSRTNGANGISGNSESKHPAINGDGTRIAFQSSSSDLTPGDANATFSDIFVRDTAALTTTLVSRSNGAAGAQTPYGSVAPAISGDGDCVSFASVADGLSPGTPGVDFLRVHMRAVRGECGATPAPPAPPAPPSATPDTTAPTVGALRIIPARFRAGSRVRPATRTRRAVGANIRFTLNEAGRVRIRVEALLPGRRVGTRCLAPRPGRTGRACTRIVLRGVIAVNGRPGANRVAFPGRVRGRLLPPGRYRIGVTATDVAGNTSRVVRRVFVVIR